MMRKEQYLEVLETRVVPTMNNHATTHYLEDKAPCHTAGVCKEFKRVRILFGGGGLVKIACDYCVTPVPIGLGFGFGLLWVWDWV